jgi:hypothetical protein
VSPSFADVAIVVSFIVATLALIAYLWRVERRSTRH